MAEVERAVKCAAPAPPLPHNSPASEAARAAHSPKRLAPVVAPVVALVLAASVAAALAAASVVVASVVDPLQLAVSRRSRSARYNAATGAGVGGGVAP